MVNQFKVGDVVWLKSGGMPMTITDDMGNGQFRRRWQDKNNTAQRIDVDQMAAIPHQILKQSCHKF